MLFLDIIVLAGPSFAAEIMEGQPTNVVVASQSSEVANKVAQYVSGMMQYMPFQNLELLY